MRCAKCLTNEASVDFLSVVEGKPLKTVPLCEDCAAPASPKSIEAIYRRISPEEFAQLQRDTRAAESFFRPKLEDLLDGLLHPEESRPQMPEKDDLRCLLIGTDWHALHFLLTGDSELKPHPLPPPPLGNAVQGGTPTEWPCEHGHVRSLNPDEVRAVAEALSKISVRELRSRFSVESFNAAKIYPHPGRARWTEKDAESVFEIYPRVVDFFQAASRAGDMILLSSD